MLRQLQFVNPFLPRCFAARDGSSIIVRPITVLDIPLIRDFQRGLSPETVRDRYDSNKSLDERMKSKNVFGLCAVNHSDDIVFVVTQLLGKILGMVQIHRDRPRSKRAEIAFLIGDGSRKKGLGTILTSHILMAASIQGIQEIYALTTPRNTSMISALLAWGFALIRDDSQVEASINLKNWQK